MIINSRVKGLYFKGDYDHDEMRGVIYHSNIHRNDDIIDFKRFLQTKFTEELFGYRYEAYRS